MVEQTSISWGPERMDELLLVNDYLPSGVVFSHLCQHPGPSHPLAIQGSTSLLILAACHPYPFSPHHPFPPAQDHSPALHSSGQPEFLAQNTFPHPSLHHQRYHPQPRHAFAEQPPVLVPHFLPPPVLAQYEPIARDPHATVAPAHSPPERASHLLADLPPAAHYSQSPSESYFRPIPENSPNTCHQEPPAQTLPTTFQPPFLPQAEHQSPLSKFINKVATTYGFQWYCVARTRLQQLASQFDLEDPEAESIIYEYLARLASVEDYLDLPTLIDLVRLLDSFILSSPLSFGVQH
ncbi:hypothetical protein JCM16303_000773 [Sporobolomyces ruberrimus]